MIECIIFNVALPIHLLWLIFLLLRRFPEKRFFWSFLLET